MIFNILNHAGYFLCLTRRPRFSASDDLRSAGGLSMREVIAGQLKNRWTIVLVHTLSLSFPAPPFFVSCFFPFLSFSFLLTTAACKKRIYAVLTTAESLQEKRGAPMLRVLST